MAFKSNNTIVRGELQKEVSSLTSNIELTEKELEFLLVTIKNGLFKGEYVELCYNVTLKIQEKYKELNQK
tara:strand:- start:441 stop:650 length:210 start_codon:yes stop_codon:yes gene_type:complete